MNILLLVISVVLFTTGTAFAISDDGDDVEDARYSCGKHRIADIESRIVNGSKAYYGEFPWLAVINYVHKVNGLFVGVKCGGFVVDRYYVATAAHCLHITAYKIHSVWLGVRKISQANDEDRGKVQRFSVEEEFVHNDYNPVSHINDIALLRLDRRIKYTDYVNPICLPRQNEEIPRNGTMLTVAGWGQLSSYPIGAYSDHKLKVQVPIYSYDECTKRLEYRIRNDQVCAEGEYLKGACWGDGGGPLMEPRRDSHHQRTWYAVGLVSARTGCGSNKPVVHTRVSSYRRWISDTINRT